MKRQVFGILIAWLISLTTGFAQTGRLKGKITDSDTGKELIGAAVVIDGTSTGITTDVMGDYNLSALKPGTYTLRCQYIAYEPQVKEQIVVREGKETIVNFSMDEIKLDLSEVKVVAKANRESENFLMLEQRQAAMAVEYIGASQLSAQGVGDAASAATKVSGIAKQEGSQSLNVRGLGDRYNTTTYNGLPLPSNNAELKNIDLGLFTTDVISYMNIEKTYSVPLYGDFGGANINIVSKRLTGDSFLTLSVKGSQNSSLFNLDKFYLNDGPGKTGFSTTKLPDIDAVKNREAYGFENSWNPVESNVVPAFGMGVSGGKSFELNEVSKLNTFFTFSFENDRSHTEKLERVVNAGGNAWDDLRGDEYNYATQTSGMINLNYARPNTEIYFNSLMLNTSKQELTTMAGHIRDVNDDPKTPGLKRRGDFQRNFVLVNQLLGEHKLTEATQLNWGLAYNYVWNSVPDRIENTYLFYYEDTNMGELDTEAVGRNYRYAQEFDDNEIAANFSISKQFGEGLTDDADYRSKVTAGYSGRIKVRNFENYQFNHQVLHAGTMVDIDKVDDFFNEENFIDRLFRIDTPTAGDENGEQKYGESYEGKVNIHAGFLMYEYNVSPKLLVLAGIRAERVFQEMKTRSRQNITGRTEKIDFNQFKVLPSLSLKYAATQKSNFRFAASQTYTLPQLQEMPFIAFAGLTDVIWGNPWLRPSTVYNADLKWEFFPKNGEAVSASVFGKYINEPINKFTIAGTFNEFVNANTGDAAHVYGVEVAAKKDLFNFSTDDQIRKVYASGNITVMTSQTDINTDKIRKETNYNFNANFNKETSELQGAAPFLANLTLGYKKRWDENNKTISIAGVYNYTSERLYSIGHSNMGDQIDQAVNTVDFIVKTKFNKFGIDFSAKNILNPYFERIQKNMDDDHLVRQYKRGATFSLSLKYNF
ncbi:MULTISPECIES: TonB-dependent receptor domain-containing protein [unclassified Carboxylicivirga]|uniref:TonB-dependent receptor n=1 Tax=Carboxylicivirga TaxID=1628153 RepID=UPI003D347960